MTAEEILRLLAERHKEDIFVPQCKTGPTQKGVLVMDAWAMRKSWAHPTTFCYEVKVSRNDFLRDVKLRDYLPYCNQLYVVCPREVIAPAEVDPDMGLIWAEANRLLTRKKAPHREIPFPVDVAKYILFWRHRPDELERDERALILRRWAIGGQKDLPGLVSRRIREIVSDLQVRIIQLDHIEEDYRRLCETLSKAELPTEPWKLQWALDRLKKAAAPVYYNIPLVRETLQRMRTDLDRALSALGEKEVQRC